MNNFSITKCVGDAWDLTVKHWVMCLVVLVIAGCSMLCNPKVTITEDMTPEEILEAYKTIFTGSFFISNILLFIISFALSAGLQKMAINGYNGEKVDTNAYKMPVSTYVKFITGSFAYNVLISIGTLFCIIPGIIIAVRLLFAPIILLDEPETEIIEAFKKSWAMTSGNFWTLFGLGLMAILVNLGGFLCCCIGFIFTAVMTIFMEIIAYYFFKNKAITDAKYEFV